MTVLLLYFLVAAALVAAYLGWRAYQIGRPPEEEVVVKVLAAGVVWPLALVFLLVVVVPTAIGEWLHRRAEASRAEASRADRSKAIESSQTP